MSQKKVNPRPLIEMLEKVAKDNDWNCGRGWPKCHMYPRAIVLDSCKNISETEDPMWIEIHVELVKHTRPNVFLVGHLTVRGWPRYVEIEEALKYRGKRPAYDDDSSVVDISEFWQIRNTKDLIEFMRVYDGVATMRGRKTLFNLPPRL